MNWVQVRHRLPEKDMPVLVFGNDECGCLYKFGKKVTKENEDGTWKSTDYIVTAKLCSDFGDWRFGEFDCQMKVSHWMHLPEEPK